MTTPPDPIDPATTALLVMDYQNGILGRIDGAADLLARAAPTIGEFRDAGGTIGYVRGAFADGEVPGGAMGRRIGSDRTAFHADSAATQIHDAIAPRDGDVVVRKTRVGPFGTTDLDEQLRARGIDTRCSWRGSRPAAVCSAPSVTATTVTTG